MNQITVTGIVLSATPAGDYDRRGVLLTRERGKIAAFARGARRTNSSSLGVTRTFSFGEFVVYEGRTSYTLMSASISNYFSELRTDVEGAYYGFYFLDFAGYYAREANDETELLKLLYQTLRALTNVHIPNRLIRCIYELKAVCINGEGPQVFECVSCGSREANMKFSVRKGGLVCRKCEIHAPEAVAVTQAVTADDLSLAGDVLMKVDGADRDVEKVCRAARTLFLLRGTCLLDLFVSQTGNMEAVTRLLEENLDENGQPLARTGKKGEFDWKTLV